MRDGTVCCDSTNKLRWFERLTDYAKALLDSGAPAVLAGDFNVMPTELDVYAPERWVDDALFRPEVREAYRRLVAQGWTDALRALHPDERTYTFWKYFRNAFARDAGLRIDQVGNPPDSADPGSLRRGRLRGRTGRWSHECSQPPLKVVTGVPAVQSFLPSLPAHDRVNRAWLRRRNDRTGQ
jgi:exodeoxyribonuclease-3